jgi:outer membrane lipoprotein-sorting protein
VLQQVEQATSLSLCGSVKTSSEPEMQFRAFIRRNLVRMEAPDKFTLIADLDKQRALELDHEKKTATIQAIQDDQLPFLANPLEQLRRLKDQPVDVLGTRDHKGRKVRIYRVTDVNLFGMKGKVANNDKESLELWVDEGSGLPMRLELRLDLPLLGKPEYRLVLEEFRWNEPLDMKLFQMEVPPVYQRRDE